MNLRQQLRGTGVAIITPFDQEGRVDFPALGKLIDHIIENRVDYIVSLGTTGETPVLSKEKKKDIVQFTFERINQRVPVVVGIGGNNTDEVAREMQQFPLNTAVAILSASPYYNKPSLGRPVSTLQSAG